MERAGQPSAQARPASRAGRAHAGQLFLGLFLVFPASPAAAGGFHVAWFAVSAASPVRPLITALLLVGALTFLVSHVDSSGRSR